MSAVRLTIGVAFILTIAASADAQSGAARPKVTAPQSIFGIDPKTPKAVTPAEATVDDVRLWLSGIMNKQQLKDIDPKLLKSLLENLPKERKTDPKQIEDMLGKHPELQNRQFLSQLEKLLQSKDFPKNLNQKLQPDNGSPQVEDGDSLRDKLKQVIESGKNDLRPDVQPKNVAGPHAEGGQPNLPKTDGGASSKPNVADNEWVKWLQKTFGDAPGSDAAMKDLVSSLEKNSGKGLFDDLPDFKDNGWKNLDQFGHSDGGSPWNSKPPEFHGPHFSESNFGGGGSNFGSGGGSSFGGGGGAGLGGGATALAIIAGIVGAMMLALLLFRKLKRNRSEQAAEAAIGSDAVDLDSIRSREQLVRAFNNVSLEQCGAEARSWNHHVVADRFGKAKPAVAGPAVEVAGLYERARYAPADEDLTAVEFADARRDLRSPGRSKNVRLRLLACILIAVAAACPACGQQKIPYKGTELLRFALHRKGFRPITEQQWFGEIQPTGDLLIVVVGDTSNLVSKYFPKNPLRKFLGLRESVAHGAAVLLIASDNLNALDRGGVLGWSTQFGITITGRTIPADPQHLYRSTPGQPFVKPKPAFPFANENSPFTLFKGVEVRGPKAIATDRPSEMTIPRDLPGFIINDLAAYPDSSVHLRDQQPIAPAKNHFAVSLRTPDPDNRGRMLVLANRNVFANGMMGFTPKADGSGDYEFDNGNWAFANRTIDWLQGGSNRKRSQCLFIEDGRIVDKFAIPVPRMPKQPVPNIRPEAVANWALHRLNDVIPWAEQNNFFNRTIGRLGLPRLMRWFLVVITVLFIYFSLRWLYRGLRRVEPTSTINKGVQAGLLPRGGVLRRRTTAQFEVGNLYEAARRRVRAASTCSALGRGATEKCRPSSRRMTLWMVRW